MTDNRDDTDSDSLSNEIVRALGKELKRLRAAHRGAEARIHNFEANHMDLETKYGNLIATAHDLDVSHEALMQEHADLKARRTELEKENVWLQQELDGTRRSLQGIKVEREEPCILTAANHYDKVKRALDESTKRREEEKLEHTRVVEGLQDKLASAAEERKLLELELEQSKRALILARRSIANEESDRTSNAESSDDDASDAVSANGADLVTSNSGEEDETLSLDDDALDDTSRDENVFDPPSFLSCKPGRKSGEPGWSLCLPPGPDGQALQALRKTLPLPSVMDQIWKCGLAETIWSSSKARCLLVFPSQRYNTTSGDYAHYTGGDHFSVGEARDLFYRPGRGWLYCGTFRCVGRSAISSNRIRHFFNKGRDNIFNTIVQRTTGSNKDLNKEVRNMYLNEELFIDCCGLEKIEKNGDIVRTLRAYEPQSSDNGRKRPSQHEDRGNKKKRRYY